MAATATGPGTAVPALERYAPQLGLLWPDPAERVLVVDGTLGFFDVSGYTRLTERLATLGAEGGEAITEIADRLFQGLIGTARRFGGDVIQFSGDALLIHFTGPGHAGRAVTAADRMQAFVREHGGLSTDVGRVRLRMSVGIHSGPATFFLLGRGQRMVLAGGAHVSATCAMEKIAEAGQVLVSHETAAQLPSAWVRAGEPGGWLRAGRADADEAPLAVVPSVDPAWAAGFVAPALRDLLLDGSLPGEYRQLSLAFVAGRAMDARLDRLGRDGVARALLRLTDVVEHLTNEHELLWVKVDAIPDGFDLVIAAGTPAMHEDDEDRLLATCRALLDAGLDLDLAVGVNRGRNFTGTIGHAQRREYSISGDATNLAARIMANAAVGELAVHTPMLERVHLRLDAAPRPPFVAKGKRLPVATTRVDGVAVGATVSTAVALGLCGRDDQLAELRRLAGEAADGHGSVVDLCGPAGIGKSRLLQELAAAIGAPVPIALGEPFGGRLAFGAIRPVLRALAGVAADADPAAAGAALRSAVERVAPELSEWAPLLAEAFDADVGTTAAADAVHPDFRNEAATARLADLVTAVAPAGTLLAFDGLQWFDDQSRDVAHALALVAPAQGWLVVGSRRVPGDGDPLPNATELALGPLDGDAAFALMLAASGDVALSDRVLQRIADRANGNPFFLRELVDLAAAGDDDFPESVERVVASRIDALAPRDRLTLRSVAVLGSSVELDLLAALLEPDPAGRALEARLAPLHAFLVVADGRARFLSATIGQVAYEGLAQRTRIELHRRAAELLGRAAEPDADRIARHCAAGRDWGGAWDATRRAAADADARGAAGAVFELRELAVRAGGRIPALDPIELAEAWESLGDAANRIGELERAHAAYGASRRLRADDGLPTARLARKRGDVAEKEGRYPQSLRWYSRGFAALDASAPSRDRELLATELELAYAATLHQQDRNPESLERARRALDRARTLDAADLVAQAHLQLATAAAILGGDDREEIAAEAERAIRSHSDDLRLACLMLNLGLTECEANDFGPGLRRYDEAAQAFARCGDVVGQALTEHNGGEVRCNLGDLDVAERAFVSARRRFRASGYRVGELLTDSGLARVLAFRGRPIEARAEYERVADGFAELGHVSFAVDTRLRIAECRLLAGEGAAARPALDELASPIAALDHNEPLRVWHRRLTAVAMPDDPDAACALLAASLGHARDRGLLLEAAIHLDTLVGLAPRAGDPVAAWTDERDALVRRLGIVRLLTVGPLPDR